MTTSESAEMIMDGLDTLSQVALAETVCFDNYHDAGFGSLRLPSESIEELNTPVTSSSDVTFFVDTLDPLPITATGRFCFFYRGHVLHDQLIAVAAI